MAQKKFTVSELIAHHQLNKAHLAKQMGMPVSTFKNKVYESLPAYHFTDEEFHRLLQILKQLSVDIANVNKVNTSAIL